MSFLLVGVRYGLTYLGSLSLSHSLFEWACVSLGDTIQCYGNFSRVLTCNVIAAFCCTLMRFFFDDTRIKIGMIKILMKIMTAMMNLTCQM